MKLELTKKILEAIKEARGRYNSDNQFARFIGLNSSQYNQLKQGKVENVVSEAKLINIARLLGVNLRDTPDWKTASTPIFEFITSQLSLCQNESQSAMLCDKSDIGKTYTAMHYARTNRNVVYVDCSQVKRKNAMICAIAQGFGIDNKGKYADVYADLVYYIKQLDNPLIILDEAGDLYYEAFLEIKALWNATENFCGWYMIGADGLRKKISRGKKNDVVGYDENWTRFGSKIIPILPPTKDDKIRLLNGIAAMIIKANSDINHTDINKVIRASIGDDGMPSLRRIYKAILINK